MSRGDKMKRDYKKEYQQHKEKYDRITAFIDLTIGVQLRSKLKEEKKTIAKWVTENAIKYLHE